MVRRKTKKKNEETNGEMTNGDLFVLREALRGVADLRGANFAYAVARNLKYLDTACNHLKKAIDPSEEFKAYDKARIALAEEYAHKDASGRPKKDPTGTRYIIAHQVKFDAEHAKLRLQHADVITEHEHKLEAFNKLMLEPAEEITFYKIAFDRVPDDITAGQLASIFPIIEGEPE